MPTDRKRTYSRTLLITAAAVLVMLIASATGADAQNPTPTPPPVEGPEPSERVAVFYYPWYGNPAVNGAWIHWEGPNFAPPEDISSDYYPALEAYSSMDPAVVANHFAWLREAGVGA